MTLDEPEVAEAEMRAAKRLYDCTLRTCRESGWKSLDALRMARALWNVSMTCYLETLRAWNGRKHG